MKLPQFDLVAPSSVAEAVALLAASDGTARVISGGQTLMPMLAYRVAAPSLLIDIRKVPGLDQITIGPDGVSLGARVRWCDIEADTRLLSALPLLRAAIVHVAHYQIRQRGTVGGSLAHADPAAEMPAIAVAHDATLVLQGPDGLRRVAAASFFRGALETALSHDEMIVSVDFPAWPAGRRWGFEELARRHGDFALAGVIAHFDMVSGRIADAHVAVFGACTRPHRVAEAEAALNGNEATREVAEAAGHALSGAIDPPGDIHASAAYRRDLAGTLAERAIIEAMTRGQAAAGEGV